MPFWVRRMELPLGGTWSARPASRYIRGGEVAISRQPAGSSLLPSLSSRNWMNPPRLSVAGRTSNDPHEWGNCPVGSCRSPHEFLDTCEISGARAERGRCPYRCCHGLSTTWFLHARRFRWIAFAKESDAGTASTGCTWRAHVRPPHLDTKRPREAISCTRA